MKPVYVLILDDERVRHEEFDKKLSRMFKSAYIPVHCYSATDAIDILETKLGFFPSIFNIIFLDFDLGFDPQPGLVVAQWLADHPTFTGDTEVIIHSMNVPGSDAIKAILPQAKQCPGWWMWE